jgi:hypothetical protein
MNKGVGVRPSPKLLPGDQHYVAGRTHAGQKQAAKQQQRAKHRGEEERYKYTVIISSDIIFNIIFHI